MLPAAPLPFHDILAYYVHHLDPYIFHFFLLQPRWYGIAYLLGFLFAYILIKKLSRDGMLRLNPERVPDLVLNSCIFGILVGGRLGYCLFYQPSLLGFTSAFPYWGVLRVWEGGMSAHGGIVFTILALLWFAHKYKSQNANPINIGDAACMVVPIGLFFGRCANFINGELYGHPTSVPWAVKFPSEIWSPTNNVQTISDEKLWGLQQAVAGYLREHWSDLSVSQVQTFLDTHKQFRDEMLVKFNAIHLNDSAQLAAIQKGIAQDVSFQDNLQRADLANWWLGPHTGLTDVMRHWFDIILPARHPSQLYEALLEGVLLFIICWTIGRLWRKDGMASGAFLTFYPIMRIIGEQFRVGDTSVSIFGLSEGVWLSLLMLLGAAIYWIYWIKRDRRIPWTPQPAFMEVSTSTPQADVQTPKTPG